MAGNKSLHAANRAKYDEFYTQLSDIEKELKHYRKHFLGKTVYCNCDDPTISNFFRYFERNFANTGSKDWLQPATKIGRQTYSVNTTRKLLPDLSMSAMEWRSPYFNSKKMAIQEPGMY